MAGQVRHLRVKGGRFYARLAVPAALQPLIGKKELIIALGGDRREAMKALPGAVAALQARLRAAENQVKGNRLDNLRSPITTQDFGRAVWLRYMATLEADDATRARYPTDEQIEAAQERLVKRVQRDGMPDNPLAVLDLSLDWLVQKDHAEFDRTARAARISAMKKELAAGHTHQIEHEIDAFLEEQSLTALPESTERKTLAKRMMRAEIEALKRTIERDQGDFTGKPSDPIVTPPAGPLVTLEPINLRILFTDYIKARQLLGKHRDGARAWENAFIHLAAFLGHADARRVTKRNLIDWRDKLVAEGRSSKTISDVFLASVRAVFRWAHENDLLPTNESEGVRQEVRKNPRIREKGYTRSEAEAVLKVSINYMPAETSNPAQRESDHITAAKRWIPILCAHSGARVTEMAQLRKEDLRKEGELWVIRVSPDAGSVKAGDYRDIPLHNQVVELGFPAFVSGAKNGPLFHNAKTPAGFLTAARGTSGRISQWLQKEKLVPDNVQPSHGFRHAFKTFARDVGADPRVIDAIQGHAGRTSGDDYGDISLIARARVISEMPAFDLNGSDRSSSGGDPA